MGGCTGGGSARDSPIFPIFLQHVPGFFFFSFQSHICPNKIKVVHRVEGRGSPAWDVWSLCAVDHGVATIQELLGRSCHGLRRPPPRKICILASKLYLEFRTRLAFHSYERPQDFETGFLHRISTQIWAALGGCLRGHFSNHTWVSSPKNMFIFREQISKVAPDSNVIHG